jgi:hypothetical protein
MSTATKRDLIGRKIVAVDFKPFDDDMGSKAHAPVLTLDNGRQVTFVVEETDTGEYGTSIQITKAEEKKPAWVKQEAWDKL